MDALIDGRELSAREIHDRLNLSRFTCRSTMAKYCTLRRRERKHRRGQGADGAAIVWERGTGGQATSGTPATGLLAAVNELIELTIETARDEIAAGRVGKVRLSSLMGQLREIKEFFDIDLVAAQRAQELHEARIKSLRKEVEVQTEGGKKSLTMGEVVDLVDKVMRGEGG